VHQNQLFDGFRQPEPYSRGDSVEKWFERPPAFEENLLVFSAADHARNVAMNQAVIGVELTPPETLLVHRDGASVCFDLLDQLPG